eukprot:TRINITY_DN12536_c0_g1_i1.p1 TRINITY_DN12536_c0_g1~~TRINITY_DN12536_c0_g1_i1.p1  ORF type:complete len:445 (+),score=132.92 TRINITY_DN12536_c0_g1_i1:192-1526(+)
MPGKPSKPAAMEQDFSGIVETAIPQNAELAKQGKLSEAIENLLALEKQTRNAGDIASTSKIATTIVQLCAENKQWKELSNNLILISKRRQQEKQVIKAVVQETMNILEQQELSVKMELLETLRTITEGKIFVENERARLTKILATLQENQGKISEAAEILQEIQVETYGTMDKREKTEFILEQVRLCLDSNDYVRAQILSKKISKKAISDESMQDLKIKFYQLMIRFYFHEEDFLEICRSYQAIYETPSVKADKEKLQYYLKRVCVFIILAPHGNEQHDFLNRIYLDKNLSLVPSFKALLKYFLTLELIRWPTFEELYKAELSQLFADEPHFLAKLWTELHRRVVAHNVRVVAGYYKAITTKRLSELLDSSQEETEKALSELVVSKLIYARINRPKGVITFTKPKDPNELLNDYSDNISNLLNLMESTCHLINREILVHSVQKK